MTLRTDQNGRLVGALGLEVIRIEAKDGQIHEIVIRGDESGLIALQESIGVAVTSGGYSSYNAESRLRVIIERSDM